jgi:outer membrane protein assembly factor BamB
MNFPDHAIYAAFNGRVFALDRRDGSILWRWKTPKGNFVTLLPDGDQLLVCSDGYL